MRLQNECPLRSDTAVRNEVGLSVLPILRRQARSSAPQTRRPTHPTPRRHCRADDIVDMDFQDPNAQTERLFRYRI